ncbi:dihydrofolate reductase [Gleimia coleocanis DSM 15436]|uniref:Dihydrofolate reductase n=1 Tax=Gleimia coleocanis DSM 15436 TaxID=525245 RepID=C0VZ67_9ACTO|nr:dihydrofolate reductase [Gleimia coleocanis]EEH64720.1 dihydrofolate reductase [Gleimia coleocanis DSM 15436]
MAVVKMIWAQDAEGKLGSGSEMLWHVPADFRHFKQSTVGFPLIMGRKSWDALGRFAPLPQRRNIVVTRNRDFIPEGGEVAFSIEEAISLASADSELVWIAGGAHIYEQAMPFADELVVTYLDLNVSTAGPVVYAPQIDPAVWEVVKAESDADWREKSGDARWKVVVYRRR